MKGRIYKLDGLRGILSLMVAFYHFPQEYFPDIISNFFILRQANYFVDIFFVLSGFIITYKYKQIQSFTNFKSFLKKRLIRLYPLLFFSVSVMLLIRLLLYVLHRTIIFKSDDLEVSKLVIEYFNSMLMLNSTSIFGATLGLNYPSWSISAEMFSYCIFGFIILLGAKYQRPIFTLIFLICFSFLFSFDNYHAIANFGFIRGILNFLMGYFTYKLLESEKRMAKNYFSWIGCGFLVLNLYFLHYIAELDKGVYALVTVPFTSSLLIYSLMKTNGFVSSFLASSPLIFLGKLSYSVYLNHIFISGITLKFCVLLLGPIESNLSKLSLICIYATILIIYSFFTHLVIEQRGAKFLKKIFSV